MVAQTVTVTHHQPTNLWLWSCAACGREQFRSSEAEARAKGQSHPNDDTGCGTSTAPPPTQNP